jgi:CubicO group peptidase (beta-lactamase class C family)
MTEAAAEIAPRNQWNDVVERVMHAAAVPGLSVAVTDRDGHVYAGAFGHSDLATMTRASQATCYRWFSMTKLVTATAALRLGDRGDLDLDAPIAEYLDEAPVGCPVSTRQLLTHMGGLANPLPVRWVHLADSSAPDQAAFLRELLGRRRMFAGRPGVRARYSNVGYLAAAEVIARVVQAPFTDHVRDVLLEPLGMHHTGFEAPEHGAAVGYLNLPRPLHPLLRRLLPAGVLGERHARVRSLNPFLIDGAGYGGLVGPVTDAARFLRLHLGDGLLDGVRILAPETAREMRRLVSRGRQFDHATAWFRDRTHGTQSQHYWEHYGTGAGFWNVARIYPEQGIGVVIMTNGSRRFDVESVMAPIAGT